jgi:tellurite resistance protein
VRTQIAPRPPGYPETRELFASHTEPVFDPYAPAEVAATMVMDLIVHPERAARLAYQDDFDANLPTLGVVLDQVTAAVWEAPVSGNAYDAELQRTVQQVWTDALLEQADNDAAAPAVQARITQHLRALHQWLQDNTGRTAETQAHRAQAHDMIGRFLNRSQESATLPADITIPPGSPIGSMTRAYVQRQEHRRALLETWSPELPACMH